MAQGGRGPDDDILPKKKPPAPAPAPTPPAGGSGPGGLIDIAKKGVADARKKQAADAAAKAQADAAAAAKANQGSSASSGPGTTISGLTNGPGGSVTIPSGGGPGGDLGSFFGVGGLSPDQLTMLLGSGGFGQELQYQLGLLANRINALKQAEDAHHNAALEAIAAGQLALAQKEEKDANAVQVERNRLQEYATNVTAQSQYAGDLMKLAETPENAFKYAFARYGERAPGGNADNLALPLPAAVKSMLAPTAGAQEQPQAAATASNPLIPGQTPTPGSAGASVPPGPPMPGAPTAGQPQPGPSGVPHPRPYGPGGVGGLLNYPVAPISPGPFHGSPPIAAPQAPPNPMHERLMTHALDMAKIGAGLLKQTGAPPAPAEPVAPQTGGYQQAQPSSAGPPGSTPANPLPSAPPPAFAQGGIAGLMPNRLADDQLASSQWWRRPFPPVAPGGGPGPGGIRPVPPVGLGPPPAPPAPPPPPIPTPSPVNANQNLAGYTGPWQTLDPYLQQLFAQTGHPTSGIPLTPPSTWNIPHLGTPSVQSMRGMTPSETANVQGYERDVEGKPIDDFKSDIDKHNEQGTGLATPTDFGTQNFAGGGLAGLGAQPPPQIPGIGQVSSGPGTFGEAGPEAAVPLQSPGGPLAMAALQANQGASPTPPPGPPPSGAGMAGGLAGLLGGPQPTSRDVGPMPTSPLVPLTDVPTNKLGPGDRGHAVGKLQQALERAGYLTMPPGANYGFYGPVTTQAVAMLQSTYPDPGSYKPGYWDAKSAKWLKSQLQGGGGPQGPSPTTSRDSGMPGETGGPVAVGGPAAGGEPSQPGGLSALMSL